MCILDIEIVPLCAGQILMTPPTHTHPGNPEESLCFSFPGLLITLFLPCSSLINHFNHFLFHYLAPFNHIHISLTPGLPRGDGVRTI